MKKFISMFAMVVLLLQCIPTVLSAAENPFSDVPAGAYYEEAVLWAVENGITTGTGATTFSPKMVCDRAQAVTFLWRAKGSPEPGTTKLDFTDVKADAYYFKAVAWAVENGITTGTGGGKFSPSMKCDRSQIVTFLWRTMGSPAATGNAPFADVSVNAYYRDAVIWAVDMGITTGTGGGNFSPLMKCDRSQIVTFLYRCFNGYKIVSQPNDYRMTSSQEDAEFTVKVKGGTAPYTYRWYVICDNDISTIPPVESNSASHTLVREFSDYDFDNYRDISVYCEITDAKGNELTSEVVYVYQYVPFMITSQPKDYQMQSSNEDAEFNVHITGGAAPYTYRWFVLYDNNEVVTEPVETSKITNSFTYEFSDYDFDDNRGIGVYCKITDANGRTVESKQANVYQYVPFAIVSQPNDYRMTSSQEDAEFTVKVKGGTAPYTYRWYVICDNDISTIPPIESNDASHTLVREFSDYDFEDYRDISVYCEITDANGKELTTVQANVYQKESYCFIKNKRRI